MKTLRKLLVISAILGMILPFIISCKDDEKQHAEILTLSALQAKVQIGEFASVQLALSDPASVSKIVVEKSIDGKKIESYKKELNVKELIFPYTFKEEIISGDETGILVYSFYGMNADNAIVDASDLVLTVELAQLPLLLKYDWSLSSQIIQGEDFATADMKDDIYRFNPDLTWELDWGDILSAGALETLNSYCGWQATMKGATVNSLSMIKYNVFSPNTPIITEYKVVKLADRKMILESRQDLSFLPGFSADEVVTETYLPLSKTDDFTPYRGQNPDNYVVESCNPGSY